MSLFLNEQSLHGQFRSSHDFLSALAVIMRSKSEIEHRNRTLYCCDELRIANVTNSSNFISEVNNISDRARKNDIIRWFDRANWSVQRRHSADELFEWNTEKVTDYSIAEAAFRSYLNMESALLSFEPSRYNSTPLPVLWYADSATPQLIEVDNMWLYADVLALLNRWDQEQRQCTINTWAQLIEWGRQFCPHLIFADYILDPLRGVPFYPSVATQAQARFSVLEDLVCAVDENGKRTASGHRLYEEHFTGDRAWFTPESPTNKQKFEKELTFRHPENERETISCPWHGKISTKFFRIHFSWPLRTPAERLYVVYLGPKITKK